MVVGIPGVGKTTVVDRLMALVRGAKLVTFGTVMADEGKKRRWIRDRDELRKLTVEKQKQLQAIAAKKIAGMKEQTVFVDTHLFIRTKEGFWPGLPFEVVMALKPTHLVLIEAGVEEVLARRVSDTRRSRDSVERKELEEEMELARIFLAVSSTLTGAPMLTVANPEGGAETAAENLAGIIRGAAK